MDSKQHSNTGNDKMPKITEMIFARLPGRIDPSQFVLAASGMLSLCKLESGMFPEFAGLEFTPVEIMEVQATGITSEKLQATGFNVVESLS